MGKGSSQRQGADGKTRAWPEEAQDFASGIPSEHRPLFDRVHRLIVEARPEATPGQDPAP